MLIGVVALVVVGPQRLPGMMSTIGKWSSKLRRMLFDVRQQSGIDDILRAEGITGGINELRALRNAVRGNVSSLTQALTSPRPSTPPATSSAAPATTAASAAAAVPAPPPVLGVEDPYAGVPYDRAREYPDEGCDAYGAIPEDLWERSRKPPVVAPFPEDPPEATATDGVVATDTADDKAAEATANEATANEATATEGASPTEASSPARAPIPAPSPVEPTSEPTSEPTVNPDQDSKTTAP